jgi:hypothetical protein
VRTYAWTSEFSESLTRTNSLSSSTRIAVGVQLVRVDGQAMKGEQASSHLTISGAPSSWRSMSRMAPSFMLVATTCPKLPAARNLAVLQSAEGTHSSHSSVVVVSSSVFSYTTTIAPGSSGCADRSSGT